MILPVELLLIIITYLPTRDIVVRGHACRHLRDIAEDERKKRLDISKLLKRYVENPEHFRHLMRETGAIIVGDLARAFFTGEDPPRTLELLFTPQERRDIVHSLDSWDSFSRKSVKIQSLWANHKGHWTREVSAFSECPLRER